MNALRLSASAIVIGAWLVLAAGCAGLVPRDPVRMYVVGLEPLSGQGLEMRVDVRLRVQNPNDSPVDYDGVSIELDLNGKPFATGVSDRKGTVPRFGETVISVPVSVSALSALRQAFRLFEEAPRENVPYVLRGKLAGGPFGRITVTERGTLDMPAWGGTDK